MTNQQFSLEGPGFIYAVSDGGQHVKLGASSNPQKRLFGIKAEYPFDRNGRTFAFIGIYPVLNMRSNERILHWIFRWYHVKGEWFKCDPFLALCVLPNWAGAEDISGQRIPPSWSLKNNIELADYFTPASEPVQ